MRHPKGAWSTLLGLTALLGGGIPLEGQVPAGNDGLLRPNDAIRIQVWGQPDLSGEFRIGADGSVQHPIYRGVAIVGIPFAEIETRLRGVLERFETRPEFVVEPLLSVFVGGDVQQPSLYYLPPETTLSQAVAGAGGPVSGARLDEGLLIRSGEELDVDLTLAGSGLDLTVRSGDQITLDASTPIFSTYISPILTVVTVAASLFAAFAR